MSIEVVPAATLQMGREVQQGNGKSRADGLAADKEPDAFQHLLNGLDREAEAPAEEMGATGGSDEAGKEKIKRKSSSAAKPAMDAVPPDAAAQMVANPLPVQAPSADKLSDAADAANGVGAVVVSKAGPPATGSDNRAASANLANYASVFEQIRLAAGNTALADAGLPAGGVAEAGKTGPGKPVLGTSVADIRADRLADLAERGASALSAAETSASRAALDASTALQAAGFEPEDVVAPKGNRAYEAGPAHQPFTATVHFESAAVVVSDTSQVRPEAAVAEQVNYWISQGIQNAELTFDGAGAQPVEVSISLSGNEAHVEFRTDQAEARDLLTGSASHLKDLLQQEGMVLSGLSVGSSGAGNAGARERRAPSEGRQSAASNAPGDPVIRPAAPIRASGRAVDLFV